MDSTEGNYLDFGGVDVHDDIVGNIVDWLCGSVWIYVPAGNTMFGGSYYRLEIEVQKHAGSTILADDLFFPAPEIPNRWELVRIVHKVAENTTYRMRFRILMDKPGEKMFICSPCVGVYSQFPWNPQRIVQTPTESFVQISDRDYRGSQIPTDGQWSVGSKIKYDQPTSGGIAGGNIGAINTPNGWKEYGNIRQ
jgi:hypothetical protein